MAGAVLALSATAANAGIIIPAGDWTVDINGNVNTFYTNTRYSGTLAGTKTNVLQTGLLPSSLGIGAKTRQNDVDVAFQVSFWMGSNANGGDQLNVGNALGNLSEDSNLYPSNGGLGYNSLNIRQSYLTFGDKSWGSFKLGRDLGVYGSDAILSDMTLLGVGSGAGSGGSSTLGRIGSGYIYADWLAQITYTTPNFNGFEVTGSVHENLGSLDNNELGFSGKATYSFAGNDATGKLWLEGTTRKIQSGTRTAAGVSSVTGERDAEGYGIGGKVGIAGAELVGYYYDGKNMDSGIGTAINTNNAAAGIATSDLDNKGGYVQATYALPIKTKIGASWGQNSIKTVGHDTERESWIVGAYHPLTKHLNLVAEYNHLKATNSDNAEGKAKTMSLGAILFF